jgi:hypothetical protein
MPGVPDGGGGLRAANARRRELLSGRDAPGALAAAERKAAEPASPQCRQVWP